MIRFPEKSPVIRFNYDLRSRYGETDQMGYVYYGRYLEYFEVARTEMIRSLGIPYSRLEEDGFMLPVVHAQLDYKAPVHYDELMTIEVSVFEKPMVRLDTYYRVLTSRLEKPHVVGQVTLCFTDSDTRKPCRAPDYFNKMIDQQS